MRFIGPVVEQLDRALIELGQSHPINHRLALILTDNAVELLAHRFATDHARSDEHNERWSPPRLTYLQRQWAHGQNFDDKLKVLVALGAITADERSFASTCHSYRNELYHVGLEHEGIMHALAGAYFRLACHLWTPLRPTHYAYGTKDRSTEIYKRVFGDGIRRTGLERIGPELAAKCPPTPDLRETLAAQAAGRLDEMVEMLEYIADGKMLNLTGKDAQLREAQLWYDYGEAWKGHRDARRKAGLDPDGVPMGIGHLMPKNWKAKHKTLPDARWRQQICRIRNAATDSQALMLYEAYRVRTAYLYGAIMAAARAFDEHVQSQIDRARGK